MTVKHITRTAVGALADTPDLTTVHTEFFETYPDVPQHPLDGPIPTD